MGVSFCFIIFFNKSITDVMKCVGVPAHAKGHAASMVVSLITQKTNVESTTLRCGLFTCDDLSCDCD